MSSSDLVTQGGTVVRDQGIGRQFSEESYNDNHRTDSSFIGLRLPSRPHRPGKHHHKHRGKTSASYTVNHTDSVAPTAVENYIASMSPSEKIQHLIGEIDEETHNIFCQLDTLQRIGIEYQWREAARWVKYEEDVEEGGSRWSKPHVASLSLHSLFELRSSLLQGAVMLSMDAYHIGQIADMILDSLINNKQLEESLRDPIRTAMVSFHWNQHQKRRRSIMPGDDDPSKAGFKRRSMKRTFSEIGRSFSVKGRENSQGHLPHRSAANLRSNPNSIPNMENMGDLPDSASSTKLNVDFMRKIPEGAEAANIMIGEMDCLKYQVTAFVRLTEGRHVGDMTEVPIPTRFIFILLGPTGSYAKNFEMGRSISTILVDEVFREVAYKARNRQDLLSGIDEFLDQGTVLPPGEWDPKIRIEPPDSVPSQEGRKVAKVPTTNSVPTTNGSPVAPKAGPQEEEEEESHCDPTLQRSGRLFGGLIADVKRKIPFYWSDYKDCFHIQCVASVIYLFLATLTPNVTFGGLLGQATEQYMGTMECILTASLCGILFALFAGQPLNILGSTGPMLVLEMILFNVCKDQGLVYMPFRCWVGLWTAGYCIIIVAFDLSALVRYITRFTEESFACLIAIIFIYEAFKKELGIIKKYPLNPHHYSDVCDCLNPIFNETLINGTNFNATYSGYNVYSQGAENSSNMVVDWRNFSTSSCEMYNGTLAGEGCEEHAEFKPNVFFLSILLFLGTYVIASTLTGMKTGQFFPSAVRQLLSDFAVLISIIVMVGIDMLIGVPTPKLNVPTEFTTSKPGRGWLINPIHPDNPWWLAIAACVPAALAVILVFMDQQITAVIVNRKENKLKKGSGYHLDMMVVAICIIACSFLGLPWYVAATVSALAHVMSLKKESECTAPGEKPTFLGVREQRVTALMVGILSGLSVFLTKVLGVIPMPVLYGVFLYMGVAALRGMQFVDRLAIIFMPSKYQPDRLYLRHVRIKRVHLFTFIQIICLSILWVIKQVKSISIVFPIMVAGTCFVRLAMEKVFTQHELKWLDDIMPEDKARAKEDKGKSETEGLLEEEYEKKESKGNFDERVNISEEMSKTSIWLQVRRDSCRQDNEDIGMRVNKKRKDRKNKELSEKEEKAAFYFGDEEEDKLKEVPE
ncbi:electroneutral sodium bicarbonate exchanger 1-like [Mizuhopecten yessoensis]|uniref:electroneutral sodium bicarbonate exchanger 1-like n=1 Tax=Mizuhopecten yessoensis TaxID=6573 RepID=UPI000B45F0A0|nr:electroneutral sodium bicarbonate exchanger 1-like [Mizuhopecten yessoensis]XP_021358104.1 electroneutral sodium bicarbonate exchanger 1-like [Mizuhopecten yessoensis]XP_021358105.1 electroneutral sodium bicarbonate exchanger 1-like [Mizuhopecten yessoensis]